MSTINLLDQELIKQLKKKIEQISGLPIPEKWTQKDYDFLVYFIEEKSGVRISLSTLKRIWKNENNRLPHISTLDALSQVAFQKNWLSLKTDLTLAPNLPNNIKPKQYNKLAKFALASILIGLLFFIGYKYFKSTPEKADMNSENVHFSARTSVDSKVPNSVVFNYDVSNIKADKFYIQQSWDARRRVEVSKENNTQTDIYYEPGLYNAKLIADNAIIAEVPVHIKTNNWFLQTLQDEKKDFYNKSLWLENGTLGLSTRANMDEKVEMNELFNLFFYNSREFNTDGDNYSYSSSFKMDSLAAVQCPKMSLIFKGENNYFVVQVLKNGCESDAYLKLSEKQISGKNNDLTMLGTDLYQWQNLKVHVKDKVLTLSLNGNEIYRNDYQKAIGSLKEITYAFNGIGMIDNVELKDVNGNITFADDFD